MSMLAGTDLAVRLESSVRSLHDPPGPPGWNHDELKDLLGPQPLAAAAVLVAVVTHAASPTLLFTQRNEGMTQHAGQVSFPGGRAEAGDADAVAAALRETQEEVGIPAHLIHPFGFLDCFETVSGYCVTPVVAYLDPAYEAKPDAREVAAVFEVPLSFLLDAQNLRSYRMTYRGHEREIFEFVYNGQRIWGATAAMLLSLIRRFKGIA